MSDTMSKIMAEPSSPTPAKPRFKIHPSYYAPMFISCVLLVAHYSFRVLEHWSFTAAAILTCIGVELVMSKVFLNKWPNIASAYVSGISVGILVRAPMLWPFALCAALTITSKYLIRCKGRHIWNPSNFGIAVMLIIAHEYVSTLSIQFGNAIYAMMVIWVLGSFIINKLKRFHITVTYVISFLAFGLFRALLTGNSFWTEIAPITGPMYQLFIFFMITDPKSTVMTKKGQIIVAFLVAAMENVLRMAGHLNLNSLTMLTTHAPYYALFTVGPIANLVEIYWPKKQEKVKLAAA